LDFQVQVVLPFRGECDAANSAATADARADAWLKIVWTGVMMRVMMCLGLSGCPSAAELSNSAFLKAANTRTGGAFLTTTGRRAATSRG